MKTIKSDTPLTEEEMRHYAYWVALEGPCKWLLEPPENESDKDKLRNFLAFYAKIKKASNQVEPGKTRILLGEDKTDGYKCIIDGHLFDTPENEVNLVIMMFMAYLASLKSSEALEELKENYESSLNSYRGRIKKMNEEIKHLKNRIGELTLSLNKAATH